jgi:uncharacterized protein (DUF736 family)
MRQRATIGTFASTGTGFNGAIKTLNLDVTQAFVRPECEASKLELISIRGIPAMIT